MQSNKSMKIHFCCHRMVYIQWISLASGICENNYCHMHIERGGGEGGG